MQQNNEAVQDDFDAEIAAAEAAASGKKAKKGKKVKTAEEIEAGSSEPKERVSFPVLDINKEAVITSVVPNPKRLNSKSYDRYDFYAVGDTIGQFLEKGGAAADIQNDVSKGFITVEPALAVKVKKEKEAEAA
jgi:hypothetical protein